MSKVIKKLNYNQMSEEQKIKCYEIGVLNRAVTNRINYGECIRDVISIKINNELTLEQVNELIGIGVLEVVEEIENDEN
jgi:hypothetical protein